MNRNTHPKWHGDGTRAPSTWKRGGQPPEILGRHTADTVSRAMTGLNGGRSVMPTMLVSRPQWSPAQKSQSSSSVATALPMTYELPEPEKKSWFSSALGLSAERIAGLTSVSSRGKSAS